MQEGKKSHECKRVSSQLEKPAEGAPAGEKDQEFLFWGKPRSPVSTDLKTVLSSGWQMQRIYIAVPTDSHCVCGLKDEHPPSGRQTDKRWAGCIPMPTAKSSDRMCWKQENEYERDGI